MGKKKTMGERLKEEILRRNKSVRDYCIKTGIKPQQMQRYISNNSYPGGEILKKLSESGIRVDYILSGDEIQGLRGASYFPIVSTMSAGKLTEFYNDETTEWIVMNYPKNENCVCLRVRGDSMSPELENKDIILVDGNKKEKENDIVAVRLKSGDQIVKRYRKHDKDSKIGRASCRERV